MAMPWQLAEGLRRRPKGRPRRLIVEQLPSINVKTINIPSPYDYKIYILPNISFRLPQLASAKVSFQTVEFHFPSLHRGQIGPIQTFNLKHIRVGFRYSPYIHLWLRQAGSKALLPQPTSSLPALHRRNQCLASTQSKPAPNLTSHTNCRLSRWPPASLPPNT